MADTDFITKSVTAEDQGRVYNGVLNMIVPNVWGSSSNNILIPPALPPYWSQSRDSVLRATTYNEAMWGAAVGITITKAASASWELKGLGERKLKRLQELYLFADGRLVGWVQFLSKHLRDFLTLDNGAFVEIVRGGKSIGSPIIGLRHLDGLRSTRTGDPKVPLLYRDRKSKIHELKAHQVMMFSDMPDPSETYYGVGNCAAGRAYPAIYKLAAIEWYLREKIAGLRPLAIYIVNGLLQNQIEGAVRAAEEQTIAKGLAAYMGAVIVGVPSDKPPQLATIPLAELPDRFNRKEEFDLAVLTYANSLGLDPQDLQPLSGQGLGTGTQSVVLAEKSAGKGLSAWRQQWTHQNNELVLPETATWIFIERDLRDMNSQADLDKKRIETMKAAIEGGIVMPEQAVQILVDQNVLPKEFLPATDMTPPMALADDEKEQPVVKPVKVDNPSFAAGGEEVQPAEGEETNPNPPMDIAQQQAADQLGEVPTVNAGNRAEQTEEETPEEEAAPEEETEEEEPKKKKEFDMQTAIEDGRNLLNGQAIADRLRRGTIQRKLLRKQKELDKIA